MSESGRPTRSGSIHTKFLYNFKDVSGYYFEEKKISRLRETDDKLFPQTTAETRNFGKIKLLTIN